MNSLTAQIIVDIINREMHMEKNHVWVRNEDEVIPNDNGLYIIVGLNNSIPMTNNVYMEERTVNGLPDMHQICQLQMQENIQIDVVSRSNLARTRLAEVLMSLQSIYGQQLQELNNFKIFRNIRSLVDASSAEGGSMINRYSITVATMVWYRKDTLLNSPRGDYYDDFRQRVDDANTIGTDTPLIEFEINKEGILP